MSWIRMDDGFAEHPKVLKVSDRAFRLHVGALCYCARRLTDGHLPAEVIRTLLQVGATKAAAELVEVGLWHLDNGGYKVNDYLDFNPSKNEVEERRAKRSEAGAKGARNRWKGAA